MSRARQKGTRWETELLTRLRAVWPHAERAPLRGVNDRGDYTACNQWLLEAKSTATPRFLEWARTARRKAAGDPWAVLWHGDRRTDLGLPLVLVDLDTFLELAAHEMTTPPRVVLPAPTADTAARGEARPAAPNEHDAAPPVVDVPPPAATHEVTP